MIKDLKTVCASMCPDAEKSDECHTESRRGFTLAEMMVVMLILTIVLAAFAPLMTKRKTVDLSSPWRYASNNSDIYYGLGSNQSAMIGQNSKADNDLNSRLTINASGDKQPHITFKKGNNHLANLIIKGTSFMFGGPYTSDTLKVTGANNTALGYQSLLNLEGGANNTAIGYQSLVDLTSKNHNTAIGFNSQRYATGEFNTSIGSNSLRGISGGTNTGSQNTILGYEAGRRLTSGKDNVAVGYGALGAGASENDATQFTGSQNTAVGSASLANITEGESNTAVGYIALRKNTTGNSNTALGVNSLEANTTGKENTAVGYNAIGVNTTGNYNTAIGYGALKSNETGSSNTAIGHGALNGIKKAYKLGYGTEVYYPSNNTAIGYNACSGKEKLKGVTCLGANSGPTDNTTYGSADHIVTFISPGMVYIPGNLVVDGYLLAGDIASDGCFKNDECNSVFRRVKTDDILYDGYGNYFNAMYRSSSKTVAPNFFGHEWELSDKLLKNIKGESKAGLEQIRQLKVFDYTFKKDNEKTPHVGVIAQDLEKVFPKAVKKGEDGYLLIRQEDMFYAVINAVKQLDKLVQGIINELKIIELKLDTLIKQETDKDKKIKDLEKRIKVLEKKLS